MTTARRFGRLFAGLAFLVTLAGCGSSTPAAPSISVSVSPTTATLAAGATQTFTATVTNDTANAGVTWTANVGTITSAGVYTAPTPVATATATITATSKTDTTKTGTATVTLTPISVSVAPPTATLICGATQTFTATVTGDATLNQGVTWSANVGTITSAGVYTAPAVITTTSATVTATSKTDTTKTGTAAVTLTPIVVNAVSPATISLGTGGTQAFTVTVSNDGSSSGVTWSIGSGAGTLSNSTTTGVTYNAPTTAIVAGSTVTLTATSIKDPTKSSTATITLTPIAVSIAPTSPVAMIGGATQSFTATVTNDGSNSGVTWSVTSGGGSFSPTATASGVASTYTSASPVAAATAVVTATSVKDPTKSVSATITLTPIAVSFGTTTSATLDAGQQYTGDVATIANDGSNSGIAFTVASGGGDIGSSSTTSTTVTTSPYNPIYYTPATVPTSTTTTITAASVKDPTRTATFNVTLNPAMAWTTPSSNTATLTGATTNTAYSYTLAASGGTGAKTYTVVSGSLPSGLTLSSSGVITGSPTGAVGSSTFGVHVTDQSSNPSILSGSFTIVVTAAPLVWTSPSTSTLTYTVGTAISPITLVTTGGTGAITYTVNSGSLPTGLNIVGNQVTGTPTAPTVVAGNLVTFKATDSATPTPATITSPTITLVANPVTLAITTTTLPTGTVGSAYNTSGYQLTSTGGTGAITWTMSPTSVVGLTLSTTGLLSGTPTGTYSSTVSITATDSATNQQQTKNVSLPLTINTNFTVSGNIYSNSNCNSTGLNGITVSINTTPVQTTTTANGGAYTFTNVPAGTYTITPSIIGPSSVFYPATQSVVVSNNKSGVIFSAALGYSISGTVAYAGSKTGRIYLVLSNSNCGGNGSQGTSISAAGAYTIRGVPPGTYTISAFMDNIGRGAQNASNPVGTGSATVATANVTGANVTLADPAAITLTAAPSLSVVAGFGSAAIGQYSPIQNSSGIEMASSYTLQWSTSSTFASVTGSQTFPATGNGTNIWILNSTANPTITNGQVLYFRASGTAGSSTSPYSSIFGPVTIGAPTGAATISGTVTFTGTATGPLYVGFYNTSNGIFYGQYIPSPSNSQAFTVNVPIGTNYYFVGILDQNNDGIIDTGDITDTNNLNTYTAITGSATGMNLALPTASGAATVTTQNTKSSSTNGSSQNYSLYFEAYGLIKLPVTASITAATNADGANPVSVTDIGLCTNCGGSGFQITANTNTVSPTVGDTYSVLLTFSDGTTQTLTPAVSAVLQAFATNLLPSCTTSGCSGTSITPTFTWTYPASATSYTYNFSICCSNNSNIWQIPGQNTKSNGFTSTQIPGASLTWGTDPTNSGNTPSLPSLTLGTTYEWQLQVTDVNNNQAVTQVQYTP